MTDSASQPHLEWIEIKKDLNEVYAEKGVKKFKNKFLENPFIPIGCVVTVGALVVGLVNFRRGNKEMSQKMMRLRVVAQGFTVAALLVGVFIGSSTTKNHSNEKKD